MKVFSLLLTIIWLGVTPLWAQEPGRLTVVGHGSVESVPDMANITMGVTAQARTAAAALADNSAATANMLKVIKEQGIEARDMQTSGLSLSPLWDNRSGNNGVPDITGYVANNQVTVRVRDLNALGTILDAVVKSGGNRFNGLSFGLQDPGPAQDSARIAAVADAARKAQLYADAAGITLGRIVVLSEAGGGPQPVMMREMAMSNAVPIAQGEVSIAASVTVVYEILP